MEEKTLNPKILRPYVKALQENKRYYLICGGRAGGRSYFASQYAEASLFTKPYFRCAIMRFVLGDIRNSIYQEIVDRLEEDELDEAVEKKGHTLTINFKRNTINGIGFRKSSSDQKAKLKSLAGYTDVIIEEAEEVSEEDFNQLDDSIRTIKADIRIFLLFNLPHKNHWIVKRWFNLVDSGVEGFYKPILKEAMESTTCFIHTTYADNRRNLNLSTIENFEKYRETNPDHYWNMIKGLVSEGARGRVFKNWTPISNQEYEELPHPISYGLDFGYSNDPTALVEIKKHNDKIYIKELIYETALTNQAISRRMKQVGVGDEYIYADSAEPKSIEELRKEGWNIYPSVKGQDSIRAGIDLLLDKKIWYNEGSKNVENEVQNYKWALDKNKEPTNQPIDEYNHAMDAIRYNVFTEEQQAKPELIIL